MSDVHRTQVSRWFAELQGLDGSDLPPADLLEWERWIEQPGNRQAFDRHVKLWGELDRLPRPAEDHRIADDYDGSVPVSQWLHGRKPLPRRRLPYRLAAAAALAALTVAAALYFSLTFDAQDSQQFATALGEHRHIRLSDGSIVTLGANSTLTVDYSDASRKADLARGEALFEVRSDSKRPFVVHAGAATVRALGTAFDVLRASDRIVVTVTRGLVEVKPAADAAPALVGKGKQVTYHALGGAAREGVVADADVVAAVSWRQGKLRYRSEPLRSVIEDVNRYSQRRVILDPAVSGLEFTGAVFHKEIDAWIDGLTLIFPVEVVNVDANTVLVRPREISGR